MLNFDGKGYLFASILIKETIYENAIHWRLNLPVGSIGGVVSCGGVWHRF